eukprot:TRINITY_DN3313_c0_g1_i4.p1 TRINITY_DN3313_c0_g1~~TRINITY_DN3313_c0_g1_i4.p1  ORF type:complete len:1035 (+),score=466.03 TRINITY_DN3313_c0_g1_i4:57-3107(+)
MAESKSGGDHEAKHSWYAASPSNEVAAALQTDLNKGLSAAEAERRLKKFGRNELDKEEGTPFWRLVLDQFMDLIVGLLCTASVVSLALGELVEGFAILAIVTLNAVIGVIQESKAEAALEALKNMSTSKAIVIRDGQQVAIDSEDIVQGDIIVLETGARVPADIRLIHVQDLQCREMALTGEPEPVKKTAEIVPADDEDEKVVESKDEKKDEKKHEKKLTQANMAFMGCEISNGRAKGIVVKTGMKTSMGSIAHLIATADAGPSPLQERLDNLGKHLGLGAIFVCGIVFLVGLKYGLEEESHSHSGHHQPVWLTMLLTSVSLAVAAVPEGLPAAVTITLALGMRDMVKRNALIRNLHSVETLGSANVICTDKTGTLTKGEMTAVNLWVAGNLMQFTGEGFDPRGNLLPANIDRNNQAAVNNYVEGLKKDDSHRALVNFPLLAGLLCSNASLSYDDKDKKWKTVGNASEIPIVVAGAKVGLDQAKLNAQYHRVKENPFHSERKMMSVLINIVNPEQIYANGPFKGARQLAVVKGAPNVVIQNCVGVQQAVDGNNQVKPLTAQDKQQILATIDELSARALRVLAIAYKTFPGEAAGDSPEHLESELVLLGLVASIDPERQEVPDAIRVAHSAGVRVVMITGDYIITARAIAERIGLIEHGAPATKAIDCETIRKLGDRIRELEGKKDRQAEKDRLCKELDSITANCDVYARAKPEDKITIVKSLQRQGNICSMTGDGVNDAPALKQADIGVAMGITGTDVSKAAASMVLIDDNFCSIVGAIEQGRIIYSNIRKFVFFLLSCNIAEILIIFFCIIAGLPSPLDPIQLLWMNLVTDGAPALALAMEPGDSKIMDEAPRPKSEPIVDRMMFIGIAIQSLASTAVTLTAYVLGLYWNQSSIWAKGEDGLMVARTMAFMVVSYAELCRAYTVRNARLSLFEIGFFSNPYMQYAFLGSASLVVVVTNIPFLMEIFHCVALPNRELLAVVALSLFPATVEEITKFCYRKTGFGIRRPQVYKSKTD